MDYKIVWYTEARSDLKSIYTYYSGLNRRTANSIASQISHQLKLLVKNPLMAAIETQLQGKKKVYRSLLTFKGKLKVIYTIYNEQIHIVMIWNCVQNPETLKNSFE